eukprot:c18290_g1_i1.p1 GENE.c18290_g1_i1~~c18290_g1_i1.p1  ORF type:complete len:294 (-),score=40.58 c18290_g1_i1:219-1061(-)
MWMPLAALVGVLAYFRVSWQRVALLIGAPFMVFAFFLIKHQESILYIPKIQNIHKLADNPRGMRNPKEANIEYTDVSYTSSDGTKISAWFMPALEASHSAPTLLFCHENAGNMGLRMQEYILMLRHLKTNIFAFDYRGYGDSEGTPSQEGLITDTEGAMRQLRVLADKGEIDPAKVILFGRSLGGAVVIHLAASQRFHGIEPAGAIIANTFTSIGDMFDHLFPVLSWNFVKERFMRLRWKSIDLVPHIELPILWLSTIHDEIVPSKHMHVLRVRFSLFSL